MTAPILNAPVSNAPIFATLGCRLNAYETEAMKGLAAVARLAEESGAGHADSLLGLGPRRDR